MGRCTNGRIKNQLWHKLQNLTGTKSQKEVSVAATPLLKKQNLEQLYSETLTEVDEKDVVMATVVGITDREVLLNIGFKSDGLVSISEFRDIPNLKVGDQVEVFVEKQEDAMGQLVISRKKARVLTAWNNIEKSFTEDAIIDGFVKRRTKGGLIVDVFRN